MPDNTNGEEQAVLERTQSGYAQQICKFGFTDGQILEIGADIGLFVRALSHSANLKADAIEPNRGVHEKLSKVLAERGTIYEAMSAIPFERKYDLIVGIHVLDHVPDLNSMIQEIRRRLSPGGRIYFVTHNERSLLRHLLGRRWPPFCLQHPQLFDKKTLESVFTSAGFVGIRVLATTNYFSLKHLAMVAAGALGLSQKIVKWVPSIVLPLRLGNIAVHGMLGS